jgi:hypothetical protein
MSGDTPTDRPGDPVAPRGVKVLLVLLLICGFGLAALPVTVYLFGRPDTRGENHEQTRDAPQPETPVKRTSDVEDPADDGVELGAASGVAAQEVAAADVSPVAPTISTRGPFALPEGWDDKWSPWFEHIDWVVGPDAGMAAARESGRPMLMFYTATW